MPRNFDTVFFSVGQDTERLHFPYILDRVNKQMISHDNGGKFNSDTREYFIKGFTYGNVSYDIYVKETGADILPGRIDAWFMKEGKNVPIPLDLLASIKMRTEEAVQNKITIYINGKQV